MCLFVLRILVLSCSHAAAIPHRGMRNEDKLYWICVDPLQVAKKSGAFLKKSGAFLKKK